MKRSRNFKLPTSPMDVAMRRLDDQMQGIDAIDNKIALVIGTASAIAALFAGFAATTIDTSKTGSLIVGVVALAVLALIYLPTAHTAFRAYWFHEWSLRPNWDQLIEFSQANSDRLVRSWVAANCVRSLKENADRLPKKLQRADAAFKLLIAEGAAAVAGMLAIVLANGVSS